MAEWDTTFEDAPVGATDLASTGDESIAGTVGAPHFDPAWGLKSEVRFRSEVEHYFGMTHDPTAVTPADPATHQDAGRHNRGAARPFFQTTTPSTILFPEYRSDRRRGPRTLDDGRIWVDPGDDFRLYVRDQTTSTAWAPVVTSGSVIEDSVTRSTDQAILAAPTTILWDLGAADPSVALPNILGAQWEIQVDFDGHVEQTAAGTQHVTVWVEESDGGAPVAIPESKTPAHFDAGNTWRPFSRRLYRVGNPNTTYTYSLLAQRGGTNAQLNGTANIPVAPAQQLETRLRVLARQITATEARSLELDAGIGEYLYTTANQSLNLANLWTVMVWFKLDDVASAGTQRVFVVRQTTSANNRITINKDAGLNRLRVQNLDKAGNLRNDVFFDGLLVSDTWYQVVVTWNGPAGANNLTVYLDGADITAGGTFDTGPNDGVFPNDMDNATNRRIAIGTSSQTPGNDRVDGHYYQMAMWDAELAPAAVTAIYNMGAPRYLNLNADFGGYTNSADLQWWFRYARDPEFIPRNWATTPPVALTIANWTLTGVDASDLEEDYPS